MSALENAAKPLLTPMITLKQKTLGPTEAAVVAFWAAKTALTLSLTSRGVMKIPHSHYFAMPADRAPHPFARVFISAYIGKSWPAFFLTRGFAVELQPKGVQQARRMDAYITTLSIGHLVLQVITGHGEPLGVDVDDKSAVAQLWPFKATVVWAPNRLGFDDEGLLAFANRFNTEDPTGYPA